MSFLGFIVAEGKVKMDPERSELLLIGPLLLVVKMFSCLLTLGLGFANFYRNFTRNFSSVAALLHALTSAKSSFQ